MRRPVIIPPLLGLLSALWAVILGTLCRFRVLPFLKEDTILSGGRQGPTEQFAHLIANLFYGAAVVVVVLILVGLVTMTKGRRRLIAQLPASQRWMYWPFHTVPPDASAGLSG